MLSRPQVLALEEHLRNMYELSAAQTRYRSAGFALCGPFGSYRENGNSVFMSMPVT